jgi:hypothetical protein
MARLLNYGKTMMILGLAILISTILVNASKLLTTESSEIDYKNNDKFSDKLINQSNNKDKNNNNLNRYYGNNPNGDEQMPVNDQISLLSKRLEILTEHRQEDYRMLERSLHSFVQKHLHEYINVDIKKELKDLR